MADADIATKACSGCKAVKSLFDFKKDKGRPDGRASRCKACAAASATAWYQANQERGKLSRCAYYEAHRDEMRAAMRAYYRRDIVRQKLNRLRWRTENRERKLASDRAWQARNPERHRMFRRVSEARRRQAVALSAENHTADQIETLLKIQRWLCACCRASIREKSHIDHVRPLKLGGSNDIRNIQLLCQRCNCRKHSKDPITFMQEQGFLL